MFITGNPSCVQRNRNGQLDEHFRIKYRVGSVLQLSQVIGPTWLVLKSEIVTSAQAARLHFHTESVKPHNLHVTSLRVPVPFCTLREHLKHVKMTGTVPGSSSGILHAYIPPHCGE